ncbi:MAG: T9SS type A sorting domain-containing protein [Chitinophagaceae bacterium]|nr:T9SS type A sorting domain-containing protein [Chitinophagaceae bacterium]
MKQVSNLLFLGFLFISNIFYAQNKSGKIWVFGSGRAATALFSDTSRPIITPRFPIPPLYFIHGHNNICDSATGNLLFSCNGMILYDSNCVIMENGDSLVPQNIYIHDNGMGAYTQSSIILPKGNNGQFYVIISTVTDTTFNKWTAPNAFKAPNDLILYHIVDINLNGGLGKVVQKNNVLLNGVEFHKTMMMACRHANGKDWWLLKQGSYDTNQIYRFLVTEDSIAGPWVQTFPGPDPNIYPKYWDLTGQFAFSPDGKKFAAVKQKCQQLFLADFDRCTGELYNTKIYNIPIDSTTQTVTQFPIDSLLQGICFSPNNQFVYISRRWNIYQFEYGEIDSSQAWFRVKHGPDTTIQKFQIYNSMHRGIDGRIYIGNWAGQYKQMSVIDKPDIKGIGCSFCRKCFRLDDTTYMGFSAPPDMPDFNLGADTTSPCWPLQSGNVKENESWQVYPNPTSQLLYITNARGKRKYLYDMMGYILFITSKDEIDVSRYAKGLYYLKIEGESKKVLVE